MPSGRISLFTQKLADKICEELASGKSLRQVCRMDGMPSEATVRAWALDDKDGFSAQYARAREIGYLSMADELLEIADDGSNDYVEHDGKYEYNGDHMQRSKLRVDTRKWLLTKALPKVFGDKQQIDHQSSDGSMTPKVYIPDNERD